MISTTGRSVNQFSRGFTLLELVLVMMIVAILAAVAAPSLRGFLAGRSNADTAAQIVALAQYARTQAVSTGDVHRLTVDTAAQMYQLSVQRGQQFQPLRTEFGRPFRLPDGVVASWEPNEGGRDYIEFTPDGRVSASSLLIRGSGGMVEIGCRSETEMLCVLSQGAR